MYLINTFRPLDILVFTVCTSSLSFRALPVWFWLLTFADVITDVSANVQWLHYFCSAVNHILNDCSFENDSIRSSWNVSHLNLSQWVSVKALRLIWIKVTIICSYNLQIIIWFVNVLNVSTGLVCLRYEMTSYIVLCCFGFHLGLSITSYHAYWHVCVMGYFC